MKLSILCSKKGFQCLPAHWLLAGLVLFIAVLQVWAVNTTGTTLTVTVLGSAVTTVDAHSVVKLTATVMAGATPLTTGQVKFCDADAAYCVDSHLLGVAQLTPAGTATLRVVPGIGNHSYKATFAGTHINAVSGSAASSLTVTGTNKTSMYLGASGWLGSYTMTGQLTARGSGGLPTGTIYFRDRADSSQQEVGKVALAKSMPGLSFTVASDHLSPISIGPMADFNNDGQQDIASLRYGRDVTSPIVLLMQLGKGDGTFTEKSQIVVTSAPNFTLAGWMAADLDGDGRLDLALIQSNSNSIRTLLGNGDGSFRKGPTYTFPPDGSHHQFYGPVSGDFNGDGIVDVAVLDFTDPRSIRILAGNGDATFTEIWSGLSMEVEGLVAADFNNDGKLDLAGVNDTHLIVFFGKGDGTFLPTEETEAGSFSDLAVGDFNGDGKQDLVVYGGERLRGEVLLGNGDGSFKTGKLDIPRPLDVMVADFNGDGIADIVVRSLGYPRLLLGNGDGSFRPIQTEWSQIKHQYVVAVADFNGDGLSDLVVYGDFPWIRLGSGSAVTLTQLTQTATISSRALTGNKRHKVIANYSGDDRFGYSVSRQVDLSGLDQPGPVATLSDTYLSFGEESLQAPSSAKTVILTNTGTLALQIESFTMVPSWRKGLSFATSNNCPANLPPAAACKIRFRFLPATPGTKTSKLVITDNALNTDQEITLTGRGVSAP